MSAYRVRRVKIGKTEQLDELAREGAWTGAVLVWHVGGTEVITSAI